jgi:hypothetical protein
MITDKLKAYDNGGLTPDRYAVVFHEAVGGLFYYATMSKDGGIYTFDSHSGPVDGEFRDTLGEEIPFKSLPKSCREDALRKAEELGIRK